MMNKGSVKIYFWLFITMTLWGGHEIAKGNYSAKELSQSLVRVIVTGGEFEGKKRNTGFATGFVWQDPLHVVTSLHAMRHGDDVRIKVQWTSAPTKEEQGPWRAKVIKVFEEADLVLLEVIPGRLPAPRWKPLTRKGLKEVGSEVIAIGYYKSSPGWRRIALKVTETQNNTLEDFPEKIVERLKTIGIPDIGLEVIHFDGGSLLPGCSGSPLVDKTGQVIGIGDGGIENGNKNLSWGIPATYLDKLMKSEVSQLPPNLVNAPLHYSAEEPLPISDVAPLQAEPDTGLPVQFFSEEISGEERIGELEFGIYEFYHTKTRSLGELLASVDKPESIYSILHSFAINYLKIKENEWNQVLEFVSREFVYDIYQDINYGVVIAVPVGARLRVEEENELLWVDFGDEDYNNDWELTYYYDADVTQEDVALLDQPVRLIQQVQQDFTEELDDIQGRAEPIYGASSILRTPGGGLVNIYQNIFDPQGKLIAFHFDKIAINNDIFLNASGLYHVMNEELFTRLVQCHSVGITCFQFNSSGPCSDDCRTAIQWLYYMVAQHLTNFMDFDMRQARLIPISNGR